MRNAIILTGIPGTGKTTIMKRLIGMMEDQHGSFSDEKTKDHDNKIAVIRTVIVLINVMCAFFIMGNIIKNW